MAYMSDRNRIEVLLPPQLMIAVLTAGVEDQEDEVFKRCYRNLQLASVEPLLGLMPKEQQKLGKRCVKLHLEITAPYRGENEEVAKVGLINFYVIKAIVDSGYLNYEEGSPLDLGIQDFITGIEPHAQIERKDRSAQKQARKVLAHLQRLGYYPGVEMSSEDA